MSSIHGTIRRYQLIIEKLNRKGFPSMREMRDYLRDVGFENSERTIQRDFEKIRFEFGVEITYDRSKNGYHIAENSAVNIEPFLRLARLAQLTEIIAQPAMKEKNILSYISFEARGDLRGLEHLAPLFSAIKSSRKVEIQHTTFYRDVARTYEIWPYMLKEYNERWYVVGWVVEKEAFRSFGVDRIDELRVADEVFDREAHRDPAPFFKDAIGLMYTTHKVERVELDFEPFQGKYVKTLPLHESQEVVEDSKERVRIRLKVSPNIELKRKIMSYGPTVKVHKPRWLAEEVVEELRKTIGQYE